MIRTCDPAAVHIKLGTIQFVDFRRNRDNAVGILLAAMEQKSNHRPCSMDESTLVVPPTPQRLKAVTVVLAFEDSTRPAEDWIVTTEQPRVIGRARDVDICLDDKSVSRHHARLSLVDDKNGAELQITDLKSVNGTRVEGRLIRSPQFLRAGDIITLGRAHLHIQAIR